MTISCRECAGLQKERKMLKEENKQLRLERTFMIQQLEAHQHALMTLTLENDELTDRLETVRVSKKIYQQMYKDTGANEEGIPDVCMECLLFKQKMAIEQGKKECDHSEDRSCNC